MKRIAIMAAALVAGALPAVAQDCAEGQRLFEHEFLAGKPVCIPEQPERVALVMNQIVPAFLLGVNSVVHNGYFDTLLVQYPNALGGADKIADIDIGWFWESTAEPILQADPDLIISGSGQDMNVQAAQIAPLITIDYGKTPSWQDTQDFVAAALGLEDKAAELSAGLETRIAKLKQDLGPEPGTFAIVRATDGSDVTVFFENNSAAQILLAAGLTFGPDILTPETAPEGSNAATYTLSAELLGEQVDVDHLFVMPNFSGSVGTTQIDFQNDPAWQRLEVVQNGGVVPTFGSGRHFVQGDIAFSHLVIDDVYRGVLDVEPEAAGNPNPYADWLASD